MWKMIVWLAWLIGAIYLWFKWPEGLALSGFWILLLVLAGCAHVVAGGRK